MQQIVLIFGFLLSSTALFASTPGTLDTTFNATGVVVTNIAQTLGTANSARAVVVDGSSNFVVAGTNGIDFAVARYTASGPLDTTFGGSSTGYITTDMGGTADTAYAVALQTDGTGDIIAAGTNGTLFALARYTSAGILDTTFGVNGDGRVTTQIGASVTNTIYGVAIDSSFRIVVAGTNGTQFVVARYSAAGVLDATFGTGGITTTTINTTAIGYSITIDSSGRIVIAGSSVSGGTTSFAVARYLGSGANAGKLDTVANGGTGFGSGAPAQGWVTTQINGNTNIAYGVAITSGGLIYACGRSGAAGTPQFTIARYTAAGVLDTGFNGSGFNRNAINNNTNIAWDVVIDSSSRPVVCGQSGPAATGQITVARYTTAGAFDTTFNTTGYNRTSIGTAPNIGYGLTINGSGNIAVAGSTTSGATTVFAVSEYVGTTGALNTAGFGNPNGYVTTNIPIGSSDTDRGCAIQPDGKIVVVGSSAGAIVVARYTINGVLDATFGTAGIVSGALGTTTASAAYDVAIQENGYIVVVGAAATSGTTPNNFVVARYTPTGILDTTFNTTGYHVQAISTTSIAYGVAIDNTGKIVVCGSSGTSLAAPIFTVARFTSAGALDTGTFGAGLGYVRTTISTLSIAFGVAFDSSGRIMVCGQSGTTVAAPIFTIARYTAAGVLDTTFNAVGYNRTAISTLSIAYDVAVNSAGNIVVCGQSGTTVALGQFTVAEYTSAGAFNSGTFGTGGTPAGTVVTTIGSASTAYALALQVNGYIVVGGISAGNVAVARYTTAGILDTTFNPSVGYVVTDLASGTESNGMGLFLQPNGRIVASTTTSSNGGDLLTLRYLGDAAPQGCIDVTYQTNGYVPFPMGETSAYMPQVTALQAQSDSSVYIATQDLATSIRSQLVKLSSTGAISLSPITVAQAGADDTIIDGTGRSLDIGTTGGHGWIRRYTTSSSFVTDSSFGASGLVIETVNSTSFQRVGQQSIGRIIVAGQGITATTGVVLGYTQSGVLDTTFGSGGIYSLATATFEDMVIDASDTIYVVYKGATNIEIRKILANGSGLDTTYGTSGIVNTGLAIGSYDGSCLAFDNNGKILLSNVVTATSVLTFQRYTTAGVLDVSLAVPQATSILTTPVIKQLQCDTNNQPLFVGYDANVYFVGRLTNSLGGLDTTFAPYSTCSGILKAMYNDVDPTDATTPKRVGAAVSIGGSGNIIFGGYEAINSTNSTSFIARVVGNTAVPYTQVKRYPGSEIGQVDTTFGVAGQLSLASMVATGAADAMQVLSSGKMIFAIGTGSNTVLLQLTSAFAADTASFGSGTGQITLAGFANPLNITIDTSGNILVVGNNGSGATVLKKVNSAGTATLWTAPFTEVIGNAICQQASGRLVMAGKSSTNGVLVGYDPNDGTIDPYFGTAGIYTTSASSQIIAAAVTSADKIVYAYRDGSNNAIVQQVIPNGSGLDSGFSFGTPIASVSADNQIRMQLDVNGKVVVVARNATGNFIAQRYLATGGNDVGPVTITITNPSTSILENILTLSDGSTLILGTDTNGNNLIVARLTPAFALDTTFNATGLLQTPLSNMTTFNALGVTSDEKIVIAGNAATGNIPYLTRVINGAAVTAVNQDAPAIDTPGTLDTTLNPTGAIPGVINLRTDLATTDLVASQAKQIINNADNSYFVAADNGTNTQITKFNIDDAQISSFGASGVLTIPSKAAVSDLFFDQGGNLIICGGSGSSGSNAGWIRRCNSTTGVLDATFIPTTPNSLDVQSVVCQQTSGRFLVAGQKNGAGVIVAYDSINGTIDTTFGTSGSYLTGYSSAVTAMIVDSSDAIYFITNNGTTATTKKIDASGGTVVWTGSTTVSNSTISSNNHIAFDQSGNVVISAVNTTTQQITITKYNPSTGVQSATANITSFTVPYVTSLVIDLHGKVVCTGYDAAPTANPTNENSFVFRVLANLSGLDTTFNGTGYQLYKISPASTVRAWYDSMITLEGKIVIVGFVNVSGADTPYLMRLFGDVFIDQSLYPIAAGAQGTLDTTFNTTGTFNLGTLNGSLPNTSATCVLAPITGENYVAFDNGSSTSYLIKLTNDTALDTNYHTTGIAVTAPQGVANMLLDGSGRIILVGTTGAGAGWIQRYTTNGIADVTFAGTGLISGLVGVATTVVEQTLARIVVAGKGSTNGILYGYQPNGTVDTVFGTSGTYSTGVAAGIYGLVADQFDRLVCAYRNPGTGAIDIVRLTSNGQLDTQFNSTGKISSAITSADQEAQVRVVVDVAGNIIVATHVSTGSGQIAIKGYSTTGTLVYSQLNITVLTSPTLTGCAATSDGDTLVYGYQSANNAMWVARITSTGSLDGTFGTSGIMTFTVAAGAQTSRLLNGCAVRYDGRLALVGYELASGIKTPFLARAYNDPYTEQQIQSPDSKTIGTNDLTLGLTGINGLLFYALAGTSAIQNQVAQAIALQGSSKIVVALDGQDTSSSASRMFISKFNIDGVLDTTFNATGQVELPTVYNNEYVRDMLTFTTVAGVNKAILAGYAASTTLGIHGSLLVQYNLDTAAMDASFGGLYQDASGTVFGDVQEHRILGRQSIGRIIAGGLNYNGTGSLVGYTSTGHVDTSFGSNGYYTIGTTGIYTHIIDPSNRVVVAYNNGSNVVALARVLANGAGLDTTFGGTGTVTTGITGLSGNTQIRVGIDQNNKIIVVAINNSGTNFVVSRYTTTGTLDVSLTITSANLGTVSALSLARMVIDNDGKVIITGSCTDVNGNWSLVVRTTTGITALDTTFNPNATPGYLKYIINGSNTNRQLTDAVIHPDGRIIVVGSEAP